VPSLDSRTALIVVDVQNDFAHPDGSLFVVGAEQVVAHANEAIEEAASAGGLIVYTQDWHPEHTPHFERDGGLWPLHCVGGSWGARFHDDLQTDAGPVVRKGVDGNDGYSGFSTRDPQSGERQATELESILRDASVEHCIVIGLATDYCVKETAVDARRLGFTVSVRADAIAAVNLNPGDGQNALAELAELGVLIT